MKNKFKIIIGIILLVIIVSLVLIYKVGRKINKTIIEYSLNEAERFGVYIINYSIDKEFINQFDDSIISTKRNHSDEIQLVDIDTKKANKLLEEVTIRIQENLIKLENGEISNFDLSNSLQGLRFKNIKQGVVCEIPEGIIYNNVFLSNIGPAIPIKMTFIGQVNSNIKTRVKKYGINNVYIEVYIHIEVKQRVIMPLSTKDIVAESDIPLAIKIINGEIPNYYLNPITKDSSQFSLPLT